MIVPPSKKIFISTSLVVTAVLLSLILGQVAVRLIEDASAGKESMAGIGDAGEQVDGFHRQSIALGVGYGVTWVLINSRTVVFVTGVYQSCKDTEMLMALNRADDPTDGNL